MTLTAPARWFLLLGPLVILLSGCVPPTYPPPHAPPPTDQAPPIADVIGSLEAAGPNVFYNNRPVAGGEYAVRSGDNISTGPDSRATLRLAGGGVVAVDENTNQNIIQEAWCILVQVITGRVTISGSDICFSTPEAGGIIGSEVNIAVNELGTVITVLTGLADIHRPVDMQLHPSEQALFAMGRVQQVRTLSRRELQSVFGWVHSPPDQGAELDSRRCRNYAQTAVSHQNENLDRRCGFTGIRWLADYDAHYRWCMQVPQSASENEQNARIQALRYQCSAVSPTDNRQRCEQYARTAVSQQHDNIERRCGFTGVRWLADYNAHYRWCMQVPQSASENEDRARSQALKYQCRLVPPKDDRQRCEQYARTAIFQQKENLKLRCGLSGHRWSQDFDFHYRWCMRAPQSSAESENLARSRELQRCSERPVIK